MTRQRRLQSASATHWVEQYEGKDIIRGYRNWFAVDMECAVVELRMLGVKISAEREKQIKASIRARADGKRQDQSAAQNAYNFGPDSDATFAYIAGRTPGGVPYGVTWEVIRQAGPPELAFHPSEWVQCGLAEWGERSQ